MATEVRLTHTQALEVIPLLDLKLNWYFLYGEPLGADGMKLVRLYNARERLNNGLPKSKRFPPYQEPTVDVSNQERDPASEPHISDCQCATCTRGDE